MCLLSPAERYIKVPSSSAKVTHYHFVITAATGGLFSKNPHILPAPALLQHLLPSLHAFARATVERAKEGWCKSVKKCLPTTETAGRRISMGEQ